MSTPEPNELDLPPIDLNKLPNQIDPDPTAHHWRQKGPYLVCQTCKVKHALFVGLTKRLSQIKSNGEIVLETV